MEIEPGANIATLKQVYQLPLLLSVISIRDLGKDPGKGMAHGKLQGGCDHTGLRGAQAHPEAEAPAGIAGKSQLLDLGLVTPILFILLSSNNSSSQPSPISLLQALSALEPSHFTFIGS